MSAYATQQDLLGEIQMADLIMLTDDDTPPSGSLNTAILGQAIANASGLIDRYCGNVYDIPFNPIPASVLSMAVTITCYKLLRRREVPDEKNKFAEEYKSVISFLEKVNRREAMLDLGASQDFGMVAANVTPTIYGCGNFPVSSR